ncbi:MAG: ligand-binding sensor domain-containing protein [Chitinophagaceae bacterium]
MRRSLICSGFFLLIIVLNATAQQVKKFYFTHYTGESGLISTEANTVIQDPEGYIWIGSVDGLQRFDGTRYKTFRNLPGDSTSIPSNHITQLLLDKRKNLWILTAEGRVGIFNTRNFRFYEASVRTRPETARSALKYLQTDEGGHIFLLFQSQELLTWDPVHNEFSGKNNFIPVPPGSGIVDLVQQPGTRNYWIGVQGGGISLYNHDTRRLSYPGNNSEGNEDIEKLAGLRGAFNFHFDKKGRFWFQVWGPAYPSVYCYEIKEPSKRISRFEFSSVLKTYYETHRFFEQADGTIWVYGLGLFARYLEDKKEFELVYNGFQNERSISYERVTALAEDREKNIWVCTGNNGLYRFNPAEQYFTNVPHTHRVSGAPGHGSVMSFVKTRWGTVLAGTWGDGLYQYDRQFNLIPTNIRGIDNNLGPTTWCLTASADSNTIWIGAQPGIYAIDQTRRSAFFYNPPVLENRTVRQVVEDKSGDLWLGMNNFGVFRWKAGDKVTGREGAITRFDKIPTVMISKILVDRLGYIWICTSSLGLYVIDPRTDSLVYHFSDTARDGFRIPEPGISSILEYSENEMVLTTAHTVHIFDRKKRTLSQIGKTEFIPGSIASMERDERGQLWVSATSGIYRINVQKKIFVRFNRIDGIENDRFTLSASYVLPDGRMLFGSSEQFIVFDPAAIIVTTEKPQPRITEFKVMNKSLLVDSLLRLNSVSLRHNNNSLEIEFSPLVFSSGVMTRYRMEGLEKEWKLAGKDNQAIYSYLPPGKYVFQMQSLDSEGNMETPVVSLAIRVNPPFWKSWWFFSLLAIAAGALLYWFDRERMQKKEAIERMRNTIAENLHGEVNTALNNINILSEMARLKADKDPEKSKEYLEQIHTKSHNMIIAMDDMLWSLDPGNDSMEKTTERMREYIDALKNRYGVNIDIAVDKKVETLGLNMKLRHEAFLIFKEGIKNLVIMGAANCHVYIRSEKNNLLFTTLFESDHCNMQQLHNLLHRQDLEKRLNMMGASIEVDLHKSHSSITLRVPVN